MLHIIKKIANKIWQYFSLLDDIVIDALTDLKSLRYQLIIWAYILNGFAFYLVYLGKADYKLAAVSIGLLTAVYAFYFVSKHNQTVMESNQSASEDEPSVERDPDA